jgi:hypothetical protein
MGDLSEHAEGLVELMESMGNDCPVFTWNAQTIRCLPAGANISKLQAIGGFGQDSDVTLCCLAADFGAYETPNDCVKAALRTRMDYQGRAYRISSIVPFPGGQVFRVIAVDLSQGA